MKIKCGLEKKYIFTDRGCLTQYLIRISYIVVIRITNNGLKKSLITQPAEYIRNVPGQKMTSSFGSGMPSAAIHSAHRVWPQ
jgi:hypothetical protein